MKRCAKGGAVSRLVVSVLVFCVCTVVSVAGAGTVHLDNGDRISGKIKSLDGESLVIASEMMGEVSVPWEHVETFSSDEAVRFELADGSVVQQTVTAGEAGQIKISGAGVLQEQTINLAEITAISEPQPAEPAPPGEAPAAEEAEEVTKMELEKQQAPWKGDIGLGLTATRGN